MKANAEKLKKAADAIERIAESDVRDAATRSYPQEYTLAWCYRAMRHFYIKLAIIALVLIAGFVVSEWILWKVMKRLIAESTENKQALDNGWGAGAILILILTCCAIGLVEKILCPEKARKLVQNVNGVKRRYRKLGKKFLIKFGEIIPDRTSLGGSGAVDLRHDARNAIEELLVDWVRKVKDLEDLGSFWRRWARGRFSSLHKKGLNLKIGIDPKDEYYFKKVPDTVLVVI